MVVRNGVDQQSITEEFRERLESMRGPREFIEGKDAAPTPRPATGRGN
jgi:hypothetical protein